MRHPWIFQGTAGITGVGTTLTKTGPGTAIFDITGFDITGNITLQGGTFGLSANVAPTTLPGAVAISNNSVISVGNMVTLTGLITDDGIAGLHKAGAGTMVITNEANTYSGPTVISGGTLQISKLANAGSNSSIGNASTNDASNLVLDGGSLHYTGPTIVLDRGLTWNGGVIQTDHDVTFQGNLTATGTFRPASPRRRRDVDL